MPSSTESASTPKDLPSSHLEGCADLLPRDRSCQKVRVTQFLVAACDGRHAGKYAMVQPRDLTGEEPGGHSKEEIDRAVDAMVGQIEARLPVQAAIARGALPDPAAKAPDIRGMNAELSRHSPGACTSSSSDADVQAHYRAHVKRLYRQQRRAVVRAMEGLGLADKRATGKDPLAAATRQAMFPDRFQPLSSRRPILALCAIFEQSWCHQGYTRGELLNSISLAPGEELTLEMHTWTKDTIKSERELALEAESRFSNRTTVRDHLEVMNKLTGEAGMESNVGLGITIPIEGVPLGIEGGGGSSAGLANTLQTTMQRTTERTVEAASTLRSQRKLRIDVARERGSDERQLRKVANTNRCHTLNVHYFEVLSNYDVRLDLVAIEPCVLIPVTLDSVTVEWVLCHEHLLRGGLLSNVFLPGFEAAGTLAAQAVLERRREQRQAAEGGGAVPESTSDPVELEARELRDGITTAWGDLQATAIEQADNIVDLMEALESGNLLAAGPALALISLDFPKLLAFGLILLNPDAKNALEALESSDDNRALAALRSFFAVVVPQDFKYINPIGNAFSKAVIELGVPEATADLLSWTYPELLQLVRDDRGLHAAVRAAHRRLAELESILQARELEGAAQASFERAAAASAFQEPDSTVSERELAEAEVEFERLRCHIEENRFHYSRLVWETLPSTEAWRVAFRGLDCFLERRPIGFVGDRAAYPVSDPDLVRRILQSGDPLRPSLEEIKDTVRERLFEHPGGRASVTLPTLGTVAEAVLGQCSACEPYIVDSRVADVRQQEAKATEGEARARLDHAEAKRREQRLTSSPPDLADPVSRDLPPLTVRVVNTSDGTGE